MTDRSGGFVSRGFGFAFAVIAIATLGVSSQASAAQPKLPAASPRAGAATATTNFDTDMKPSSVARRVNIDIDPIDPSVRHRWPDLSDSSSSDMRSDKS